MPGVMNESNDEDFAKEIDGHYVPNKESFTERSPRSPLNTHSPPMSTMSPGSDSLDLAIDGVMETSIEQLYNNVCEMQSSDDHSPSRRSFLSYGEESRLDSELRFFAGGDYIVTTESKKGIDHSPPLDVMTFISPNEVNEEASRKVLRSKSLHGKLPNGKKGLKKEPSKLGVFSSMKKGKNPPLNVEQGEAGYLGPYLLKQARDLIVLGDKSQKALELALRAKKQFEMVGGEKPNLDFVMCLHVVAALYCRMGRYSEAIPVLEKSINIPVMDLGQNHALAKFAGCMQLGDTYAILGQIENSILFYSAGLEIQRQVLGEKDPRFGETCRYLAEAHVQAMQFDEAEKLCLMALDIHNKNGTSASPEEVADRRLLGLICDSKGDHEGALEHYVLAGMAMAANGQSSDMAAIDCNIGDAYLSLARYDEAIFAYQKALNAFKSNKGENHLSVASVFVCLSDLYNKIGKFGDAKSYLENALRIYAKPTPGSPPEEIARGLVHISTILESMNETDRALQLLQKAIKVYENAPGQQSTIAGIEAQTGFLYYLMGSYSESYNSLKNATLKFRASGEKKSAFFGFALNQMGLVCVQLVLIDEAAALFEEARDILEAEYGPNNVDTLGVYSNLAGTYDAMGRNVDAIEILEYIVKIREEILGTATPEVEDEKWRLAELLKEAGMARNRKSRSLETLLVHNSRDVVRSHDIEIEVL